MFSFWFKNSSMLTQKKKKKSIEGQNNIIVHLNMIRPKYNDKVCIGIEIRFMNLMFN